MLICLIPPMIVRLYDRQKLLKQENEALLRERKIHKQFGSYSLEMKDIEEEIPVSRQYLYTIKSLQ
jgi:hypothetical protein